MFPSLITPNEAPADGVPIRAGLFGTSETLYVVPQDVLAVVSGVNHGSVMRVLAAIHWLNRVADIRVDQILKLENAAATPPVNSPERKAAVKELVQHGLAYGSEDSVAEATAEWLGLPQRAIHLKD